MVEDVIRITKYYNGKPTKTELISFLSDKVKNSLGSLWQKTVDELMELTEKKLEEINE